MLAVPGASHYTLVESGPLRGYSIDLDKEGMRRIYRVPSIPAKTDFGDNLVSFNATAVAGNGGTFAKVKASSGETSLLFFQAGGETFMVRDANGADEAELTELAESAVAVSGFSPPAEGSSGLTLFIDANGATNGTCNEADASATVPSSATAHSVQICQAGNSEGNVDAVDLRISYNDALLAGSPEIDCPAAGGGTNCVDDNPNLNDGVAALGTGWSCTAFGTSQPRADESGPGTGRAVLQCNAAIGSPSASLQNGLLGTLTLDPIAPGVVTLELGASGVTRQGASPVTCGDGLTCIGATVTVQ